MENVIETKVLKNKDCNFQNNEDNEEDWKIVDGIGITDWRENNFGRTSTSGIVFNTKNVLDFWEDSERKT